MMPTLDAPRGLPPEPGPRRWRAAGTRFGPYEIVAPLGAGDSPRILLDLAVQLADGRVKILDFGLTKAADAPAT